MARIQHNFAILAAASVLLAVTVSAQSTNPPPTAAPSTVNCIDATSMAFNASQLIGSWWEAARQPALVKPISCAETIFSLSSDNQTLLINNIFADNSQFLYINNSYKANISLTTATPNTSGYNLTFTMEGKKLPSVVYKLLATDYNNYAFVCGYTNASMSNSTYGVVLTRTRFMNQTILNGYEALAATSYSDFANGTMSTITQSPQCYASGAATMMPFLSALFAALYALLKFVN